MVKKCRKSSRRLQPHFLSICIYGLVIRATRTPGLTRAASKIGRKSDYKMHAHTSTDYVRYFSSTRAARRRGRSVRRFPIFRELHIGDVIFGGIG